MHFLFDSRLLTFSLSCLCLLCTGLKSIRNCIFQSKVSGGGTRLLTLPGHGLILYDVLVEALRRDEARTARGAATRTALTHESLFLSSWSVMTVKHAKNIFAASTIKELISEAASVLKVPIPKPSAEYVNTRCICVVALHFS